MGKPPKSADVVHLADLRKNKEEPFDFKTALQIKDTSEVAQQVIDTTCNLCRYCLDNTSYYQADGIMQACGDVYYCTKTSFDSIEDAVVANIQIDMQMKGIEVDVRKKDFFDTYLVEIEIIFSEISGKKIVSYRVTEISSSDVIISNSLPIDAPELQHLPCSDARFGLFQDESHPGCTKFEAK